MVRCHQVVVSSTSLFQPVGMKVHVCVHVCACMCVYMCVHVCVCVYMCLSVPLVHMCRVLVCNVNDDVMCVPRVGGASQ